MQEFEMLLGNSDIELNKLKKFIPGKGKKGKAKKEALPEDIVFR